MWILNILVFIVGSVLSILLSNAFFVVIPASFFWGAVLYILSAVFFLWGATGLWGAFYTGFCRLLEDNTSAGHCATVFVFPFVCYVMYVFATV